MFVKVPCADANSGGSRWSVMSAVSCGAPRPARGGDPESGRRPDHIACDGTCRGVAAPARPGEASQGRARDRALLLTGARPTSGAHLWTAQTTQAARLPRLPPPVPTCGRSSLAGRGDVQPDSSGLYRQKGSARKINVPGAPRPTSAFHYGPTHVSSSESSSWNSRTSPLLTVPLMSTSSKTSTPSFSTIMPELGQDVGVHVGDCPPPG